MLMMMMMMLMIMLDLQKAFDTVDHDILCDKSKVMGVESVKLVQIIFICQKTVCLYK